jgi:hypothetical protein
MYVVDGRNSEDLVKLDSDGFDTWRGHPQTRIGDLILMYRTAPFSDIGYVFVAGSNSWPTPVSRNWPWKHAVEIADGYRLQRVIRLQELKETASLRHWDFLKNQRGAANRRADLQEQGVWPPLKRLLESQDHGLREHFRGAWSGRGPRQSVFLSYASDDKRKAQGLYEALARSGLDVWLDRHELQPGKDWDLEIQHAIRKSKGFVVCISKSWVERHSDSYVKREFDIALQEDKRRSGRFIFQLLFDNIGIPGARHLHATRLSGRNRRKQIKKFAGKIRSSLFPDVHSQ